MSRVLDSSSMTHLVRLGAPGAGAGGGQLLAVHIPGLQLTRVPAAGELLALRPGHGVVVEAGPGITMSLPWVIKSQF